MRFYLQNNIRTINTCKLIPKFKFAVFILINYICITIIYTRIL